jgi:hypothetical protein
MQGKCYCHCFVAVILRRDQIKIKIQRRDPDFVHTVFQQFSLHHALNIMFLSAVIEVSFHNFVSMLYFFILPA